MTDIDQEKWDNSNLFTSASEVSNEETIAFSGTIPKWLKGTLYRNGLGANDINNDPPTSVNHAFDGFAFIQKYAIDGSSQTVRFRTLFIKSRAYKEAIKRVHLTTRQFGTDPCKSIFARFQAIFPGNDIQTLTDDTHVTVQIVSNELMALTETMIGNIFGSDTLETVGPLTALPYKQLVESEIFTATTIHVMHDDKRSMTVGCASRITPRNSWLDAIFISDENTKNVASTETELDHEKIISVNDRFLLFTSEMSERGKNFNRRSTRIQDRFVLPFEKVSYMHSASLTENFLVLTEIPLHFSRFSVLRTLPSGTAITNMFNWNGDNMSTIFRVINLDTGEQIAQIPGSAFFNFHHINAFGLKMEDTTTILIDICAYDDHHLKTNKRIEPYAGARTGQGVYPISYANSLVPVQFELPRINPYYIGKSYCCFYAAHSPPDRFIDALIKVDAESKKECAIWELPFTSPSEPVFVPKPHANGDHNSIEDDGVVLSVVLDQKRKQSFLLVLDRSTFTELRRAYVPIHIPLSFHGNFY
ncbi:unnamed protein product [Rotaria magnacalcarata]|uniref:Uncharacterized protein n=2 Tax=Rotaria magnacalcarata TaxID=392030 RepID=A0A816ZPH6_9BILA|nr:unnamed protein product [Rotaria magnacalcarata]